MTAEELDRIMDVPLRMIVAQMPEGARVFCVFLAGEMSGGLGNVDGPEAVDTLLAALSSIAIGILGDDPRGADLLVANLRARVDQRLALLREGKGMTVREMGERSN